MASPQWKVLYENVPIPLEGVLFTQKQLISAQERGDLGTVVVVQKVITGVRGKNEFAVLSKNKWMVLQGRYSSQKLKKLLDALDDYRAPVDGDDSGQELPDELLAVAA